MSKSTRGSNETKKNTPRVLAPPQQRPNSRRDGEVAAIRMLQELERMNWKREASAGSAQFVDARIREAVMWPAEARRGFTSVISDWLHYDVIGVCLTSMGTLPSGMYPVLRGRPRHENATRTE